MPYAEVNGQRIYFEDTGGDGPAIVFSHGLLMDHEMFAPQIAALGNRYRCITWDERGHGLTAGASCEPFSYYDSADDLAALLQHLGIARAALAGMSQGGYLSLRCALRHPGIVSALVLLDTQAAAEDPVKLPGYEAMMGDWLEHGLSDELATMLEHIIIGPDWPGAANWKAKWKSWSPHNLVQCFQTLALRDDISEAIRTIRVPTLVVHGEADASIDVAQGHAMAKAIAGARLELIPEGGHACCLTHAQQVNPIIEQFLACCLEVGPGCQQNEPSSNMDAPTMRNAGGSGHECS